MRPTGNCAGYVTSRWLLLRIPGPASVTCLRRPSQSRRRRVIDLHDNDAGRPQVGAMRPRGPAHRNTSRKKQMAVVGV